jgi:hypothetical protein
VEALATSEEEDPDEEDKMVNNYKIVLMIYFDGPPSAKKIEIDLSFKYPKK